MIKKLKYKKIGEKYDNILYQIENTNIVAIELAYEQYPAELKRFLSFLPADSRIVSGEIALTGSIYLAIEVLGRSFFIRLSDHCGGGSRTRAYSAGFQWRNIRQSFK